MREYASRLRDLRTDRDLSQTQIAMILGTSKNQVGKYERGEQELPIRHLITLCKFYNVSADYLLDTTPDSKRKQKRN